jgi:hypothetical protein
MSTNGGAQVSVALVSTATALGIGLLLALGAGSASHSKDDPPLKTKVDSDPLASLEAKYKSLSERYDSLTEDLNKLSKYSPPIGAVMAYPGIWPSDPAERSKFEDELGWMICDGRLLPLTDKAFLSLAERLVLKEINGQKVYVYGGATNEGFFKLPDYRGYFLRGVAHGAKKVDGTKVDPDCERRVGGDVVGSFQDWATGMPQEGKKWETDQTGQHSHIDPAQPAHKYVLNASGQKTATGFDSMHEQPHEPDLNDSTALLDAGLHNHTISGGQSETRPINYAVEWIIKFR